MTGTLFLYEWKAKDECFTTNRDYCNLIGAFTIKAQTKNFWDNACIGVVKRQKQYCEELCIQGKAEAGDFVLLIKEKRSRFLICSAFVNCFVLYNLRPMST